MTALRKEFTATDTADLGMLTGDHVELLSTSAAPTCTDMMAGDASGAFSSGSTPVSSMHVETGDGTHMFSSGS